MYEPVADIANLKEVLEKVKCDEHHIPAIISVFDSTMIMKCCCPEFHKQSRLLAEELNESLGIKNLIIK